MTRPAALTLQVSPHGRLLLVDADDAPAMDANVARRLNAAFAQSSAHGLLHLGASAVGAPLPPVVAYWRDFAARYVTAACGSPGADGHLLAVEMPVPATDTLEAVVSAAPPMTGIEYLTPAVLARLWRDLDAAFRQDLAASKQSLQQFLHGQHPAWSVVGRVHVNLAEYRLDPDTPFAFVATYTKELFSHGKARHAPLGRALEEFAGAANKARLLSLLMPVQRAAASCPGRGRPLASW